MKIIPYYLILLLATASCSSESKIDVKSWEVIDPGALNKKIQKAYKANLSWVIKPGLYALYLFDLDELRQLSYEYKSDNIENPKHVYISITRDGFLDDSVRGDIQHIKLSKNDKGKWKIVSIKKAISCWRSKKLIYSSDSCP